MSPRAFFGLIATAGSLASTGLFAAQPFPQDPSGWPEPAATHKPWTRWWWLGSAVDPKELTRELEAFAGAGIGGVEICPIYGAMGAEDRFVEFLSPPWMERLAHTTREAKRLGMQVDLTTGTGWPFGAPWVNADTASKALQRINSNAEGGKPVDLKLPEGTLEALRAFPDDGPPIDLAPFVRNGRLQWTPPPGRWTVAGISAKSGIQKVKRAAPGGEGLVLDPFSPDSARSYLTRFDQAFGGFTAPMPRAQFHDSFEYYGADWTPSLWRTFIARHGYDLRDQLAAFNGKGEPDAVARIRADYRDTLGELHRTYLKAWHDWTAKHGGVTRNQAHGSPGNLLDHYAVSEIPETEIFRHVSEDQLPMLRFAASAAHSNGTTLVSSETFTWLGEHFQVTPEALKEAADFVFLGGVNHVFFHGIPHSPENAGWPGWLFYASTHMGPNGGLWRDLPAFNGYLERCQSILQHGTPDSEVLIYFPFADTIHGGEEKLPLFTIHNQNQWLHPMPFHRAAMECLEAGITFDFASDAMLERATAKEGMIHLGNNTFRLLVVPGAKHLPVPTMKNLARLKSAGARIEFVASGDPHDLDVPGFRQTAERRAELRRLFTEHFGGWSKDTTADLARAAGVAAEPMRAQGLRFVRRKHSGGYHYFIVNTGRHEFNGSIKPARGFKSAVVLDPWNPERRGVASTAEIPLRLAPLQSIILRTFNEIMIDGPPWTIDGPPVTEIPINGPWKLEFASGGPALPESREIAMTAPWTTLPDPQMSSFSGTGRYTTSIDVPMTGRRVVLDLGRVLHTARIHVNGRPAGVSWMAPHRIDLTGKLRQGPNEIAVEVTNLAANRIADLDRRKVDWKRFHEINFVNIDYKPFDASQWPIMESGLAGPVRLLIHD